MPTSDSPTTGAPAPHGGRPVVTSGAPRGATEVVVLALHGRGATAQGIVNLLNPLYRHGVTFLAPDAHKSRWFPYAATAGRDRNEPGISAAVAVVDALVDHATTTFDVSRERVVLVGFSQGAAVAAEYALATPQRLGAIACLSGAALDPETGGVPNESFDGTPVLVSVGRDDPHVSVDAVEATADAFRDRDADVTERVHDDTGHEVTDDDFAWLADVLDVLLAT
jgi:phospholipase/carboxylesterase